MAPEDKEPTAEGAEGQTEAKAVGQEEEQGTEKKLSTAHILHVLITLYGISAASSLGTGLVTIGIPHIAQDLSLPNGLLLWPGSAFSLASGCSFLISGKMADLFGPRLIGLSGCVLMVISLGVAGVSQTGVQFIILRALQGIGAAMYLPTNVSIWTSAVPKGRLRNVGFACLSFSSPVGLQTGYLLAGAFSASQSWRYGFYLCAGIMGLLVILGFLTFPPDRRIKLTTKNALHELDLIGMLVSIIALGFLGFALAELSDSVSKIKTPQVISSLIIAIVLGAVFVHWMSLRQRQSHSPLVPNHLWENPRFTVICVLVVLCWATTNSIECFFSLYFQKVRGLSGLQTAIWFIPNVLIGLFTGVFTGYLVHRLPINIFVTLSSLVSTAAPLIMALMDPAWSYWIAAFWALIVAPTAQDVMYTVSNIVITETMPDSQHGLAGGVFNALGGVGTSLGIAIIAIVSESVIQERKSMGSVESESLLHGYRAAFWTSFGMCVAITVVGAIGLRSTWHIGRE